MSKLDKISSPYNSDLATSLSMNENFSDFNTIDNRKMNIIPTIQGIHENEYVEEEEEEIAINYDVEGEDENSSYPQFITYVDHPVIKNKFNIEYEFPEQPNPEQPHNNSTKDVNVHFDGIVNFYFASIGVIGLFILFRTMQKSRF